MNITIQPGKLSGTVQAIPSKSMAHRYLICAAFAKTATNLICPETSADIEATANCLRALGAHILRTKDGYAIEPIASAPSRATLPCSESGSTLRFLLPIVGALGVNATFLLEGRLPQRPLSPLWEEMERMGCKLTRPTDHTIRCQGKLLAGDYCIDGSVSSQFISGLQFALPLIEGETTLRVTGNVESKPYLAMTAHALDIFRYPGSVSPENVRVEGDWSNAAFWLAANALGSDVTVTGLNHDSAQGDKAIRTLLPFPETVSTVCAGDIPDLVPILSIVAAAGQGVSFTNINRLRLKESDRVASIMAMITALGGRAEATENTLTVYGTGLHGGMVDSFGDHRIAMSAAIASTVCAAPVTILGAECVEKSYPQFWDDFIRLGGTYEKYLR